jgi:hypothetical protein
VLRKLLWPDRGQVKCDLRKMRNGELHHSGIQIEEGAVMINATRVGENINACRGLGGETEGKNQLASSRSRCYNKSEV